MQTVIPGNTNDLCDASLFEGIVQTRDNYAAQLLFAIPAVTFKWPFANIESEIFVRSRNSQQTSFARRRHKRQSRSYPSALRKYRAHKKWTIFTTSQQRIESECCDEMAAIATDDGRHLCAMTRMRILATPSWGRRNVLYWRSVQSPGHLRRTN